MMPPLDKKKTEGREDTHVNPPPHYSNQSVMLPLVGIKGKEGLTRETYAEVAKSPPCSPHRGGANEPTLMPVSSRRMTRAPESLSNGTTKDTLRDTDERSGSRARPHFQ